jgi:hypothetical protein
VWRNRSHDLISPALARNEKTLPEGNVVEKIQNGNSTATSRGDRRRSHRVSAAPKLSTKKFTEFSSPRKTRAVLRKIPQNFFSTHETKISRNLINLNLRRFEVPRSARYAGSQRLITRQKLGQQAA